MSKSRKSRYDSLSGLTFRISLSDASQFPVVISYMASRGIVYLPTSGDSLNPCFAIPERFSSKEQSD